MYSVRLFVFFLFSQSRTSVSRLSRFLFLARIRIFQFPKFLTCISRRFFAHGFDHLFTIFALKYMEILNTDIRTDAYAMCCVVYGIDHHQMEQN